jgi:2-C-methyl-D-erythritol 2,4-cyclodiphosphate synthase
MTNLRIGHGYDIHRFIKKDSAYKNNHENKYSYINGTDSKSIVNIAGNSPDNPDSPDNPVPLYLGGVLIENHAGTIAHSDGDVALHALTDALLGASSLPDIGTIFPDNLETTKGLNSLYMLKEAYKMVKNSGYSLVNADITIITQTPKIKDYKDKMILTISEALSISYSSINIKGKTKEGLDLVGRGEAIECFAICLLEKI